MRVLLRDYKCSKESTARRLSRIGKNSRLVYDELEIYKDVSSKLGDKELVDLEFKLKPEQAYVHITKSSSK